MPDIREFKILDGGAKDEEETQELSLEIMTCEVCTWPHFRLMLDQDWLTYSECLGCGEIAGIGEHHLKPIDDETTDD